jgi:hypothetical protein
MRLRHVHAREFWGEGDGQILTAWLNRKNRPAGDPVEKLVRLLSGPVDPLRDVRREIGNIVRLSVRQSGFAMSPAVSVTATGEWSVKWILLGSMKPEHGLAFIKLLRLAEDGLLARVRQCAWQECRRWHFQRFTHQVFCTSRCQQRAAHSTPQWKAARRIYMRRLRRQIKNRERKELELSKATAKGKRR